MLRLGKVGWAIVIAVLLLTGRVVYLIKQRAIIPELTPAFVPVLPLDLPPLDYKNEFPKTFSLQVAILWVDDTRPPLSLIHAFRQMGIPFFIT
ncbi:MAG: hypothetical protein AB7G75_07385 [Candidatus Binatia bacterium]